MSNAQSAAIIRFATVILARWRMSIVKLEKIAAEVDEALTGAESGAVDGGSLLVMVGLPGSGKSLVARTLQGMVSSVVVSTDVARGFLGYEPVYSDDELRFVYEVCYRVARMRLRDGQRVIFDGSNHAAAHRARLAELAGECGAAAAFCYVYASDEVVFERLRLRDSSDRPEDVQSNARWEINRLMAGQEEPILRPHLKLDSSSATPEELAAAALAFWLDGERVG